MAQQGAQRLPSGGIDVGRRNEVGAEQVSKLFGIDAVVLVFAAASRERLLTLPAVQPMLPEKPKGLDGSITRATLDAALSLWLHFGARWRHVVSPDVVLSAHHIRPIRIRRQM